MDFSLKGRRWKCNAVKVTPGKCLVKGASTSTLQVTNKLSITGTMEGRNAILTMQRWIQPAGWALATRKAVDFGHVKDISEFGTVSVYKLKLSQLNPQCKASQQSF